MRKFAFAAFMSAAALLGGCTTAQIEQATTTVEADIQAGTAALCGIIPTLQTITSVAAVMFPGISSITAVAVAGEGAIEQDICSAAPAPASARYRALPRVGSAPAVIGVTPHQVVVHGWRAH